MCRGVLELAHTSSQQLIVFISSQPYVLLFHTDSLQLAMVGVFTPWELASAHLFGFFSANLLVKHS